MNYKEARQTPSGKWHYTNSNHGSTYPIGYCSEYESCSDCPDPCSVSDKCVTCDNTGAVLKKTPCPGHDTAEEACSHYRDYLLDNAKYDVLDEHCREKCKVCGTWTNQLAMVNVYDLHRLCELHCNREGLDQVLRPVFSSMES